MGVYMVYPVEYVLSVWEALLFPEGCAVCQYHLAVGRIWNPAEHATQHHKSY